MNAAPEWQLVNTRSWYNVEEATRNLALNSNHFLNIITGTYDIIELPDSRLNFVPLYLGNPNPTVQVPKIFYKIITTGEVTRRGVVLLGERHYKGICLLKNLKNFL